MHRACPRLAVGDGWWSHHWMRRISLLALVVAFGCGTSGSNDNGNGSGDGGGPGGDGDGGTTTQDGGYADTGTPWDGGVPPLPAAKCVSPVALVDVTTPTTVVGNRHALRRAPRPRYAPPSPRAASSRSTAARPSTR